MPRVVSLRLLSEGVRVYSEGVPPDGWVFSDNPEPRDLEEYEEDPVLLTPDELRIVAGSVLF